MRDDLTLERWQALPARERDAAARRLAIELPGGFRYDGLHTYEMGDRRNEVAEFDYAGARFVLIPGGSVTLGYDLDRAWRPTPEERDSWEEAAAEFQMDLSIHDYIGEVTLRTRPAEVPPLLMECAAIELGWKPVPLDDARVTVALEEGRPIREVIARHRPIGVPDPGPLFTRYGPDIALRVTRRDGELVAESAQMHTHAEYSALLARDGFRFPTSDEWELACGAASPALFRWGDHAPCDRFPMDTDPGLPAWTLHREPNAFGIHVAEDPYKRELISDPRFFRGGDGGCIACGGGGFFLVWLTLATACFEPEAHQRDPAEPVLDGYTIGRRVLPLAQVP
jgi:hypothetical protein